MKILLQAKVYFKNKNPGLDSQNSSKRFNQKKLYMVYWKIVEAKARVQILEEKQRKIWVS